jgi:hypothetical protein
MRRSASSTCVTSKRQATPLFATERFTRGIEEAFTRIHERHRAGLPPDHIDLSR